MSDMSYEIFIMSMSMNQAQYLNTICHMHMITNKPTTNSKEINNTKKRKIILISKFTNQSFQNLQYFRKYIVTCILCHDIGIILSLGPALEQKSNAYTIIVDCL